MYIYPSNVHHFFVSPEKTVFLAFVSCSVFVYLVKLCVFAACFCIWLLCMCCQSVWMFS